MQLGQLKRRTFIKLLGGAAAWPLAAHAQQPERMRLIGMLMGFAESDHEAQSWVAAFREELQKLGWTEGRNIEIDTRWAAADVELMKRFAKELVALQPGRPQLQVRSERTEKFAPLHVRPHAQEKA
jgi:putative tryptophan/tyrosine transport system substrate-binding protein